MLSQEATKKAEGGEATKKPESNEKLNEKNVEEKAPLIAAEAEGDAGEAEEGKKKKKKGAKEDAKEKGILIYDYAI